MKLEEEAKRFSDEKKKRLTAGQKAKRQQFVTAALTGLLAHNPNARPEDIRSAAFNWGDYMLGYEND